MENCEFKIGHICPPDRMSLPPGHGVNTQFTDIACFFWKTKDLADDGKVPDWNKWMHCFNTGKFILGKIDVESIKYNKWKTTYGQIGNNMLNGKAHFTLSPLLAPFKPTAMEVS